MIGRFEELSKTADELYYILEDHQVGLDDYDMDASNAVAEYLEAKGLQWSLGCEDWPNMTGGICYYSWIENGKLHMEAFTYVR